MRTRLEVVIAELKARLDLRCSYCGASVLFGRHRGRAPFLAAAPIASVQQVHRLLLSGRRFPSQSMDVFLAVCTVALGCWVGSLFTAPDRTRVPRPDAAAAGRTPAVLLVAGKEEHPILFAKAAWADLSFTPEGKLAPRLREPQETERASDPEPRPEAEPSAGARIVGAGTSPTSPGRAELDATTTGSLRPLVGVWGPDTSACRRSASKRTGFLPMVIASDKARAGPASCRLQDVQQSGSEWTVIAQCSAGRSRWTSRVSLVLNGSRLSWKSARGAQDYVRCDSIKVARAGD